MTTTTDVISELLSKDMMVAIQKLLITNEAFSNGINEVQIKWHVHEKTMCNIKNKRQMPKKHTKYCVNVVYGQKDSEYSKTLYSTIPGYLSRVVT